MMLSYPRWTYDIIFQFMRLWQQHHVHLCRRRQVHGHDRRQNNVTMSLSMLANCCAQHLRCLHTCFHQVISVIFYINMILQQLNTSTVPFHSSTVLQRQSYAGHYLHTYIVETTELMNVLWLLRRGNPSSAASLVPVVNTSLQQNVLRLLTSGQNRCNISNISKTCTDQNPV